MELLVWYSRKTSKNRTLKITGLPVRDKFKYLVKLLIKWEKGKVNLEKGG